MIHILQFFLRHLIFFGLLTWLALGIYFHEHLFPGLKLPNLAAATQTVKKTPKAAPAAAAPAAPTVPQSVSSEVPDQAPAQAEIEDPAAISAQVMAPVTDAPAASEAAPSPQVEGFQFRPDDTVPATPEDAKYLNFMNQARALMEKEDWAGAEAVYLRLALEFPDRAEPYGELGNLYLYRKDNAKAADAYWQAALRLKGEDQAQRLQGLLDVLDQIDPDKAKSLREQVAKP